MSTKNEKNEEKALRIRPLNVRKGRPVCRRLADKSIKRPNGKAMYRRNSVAARLPTYLPTRDTYVLRIYLCINVRARVREHGHLRVENSAKQEKKLISTNVKSSRMTGYRTYFTIFVK